MSPIFIAENPIGAAGTFAHPIGPPIGNVMNDDAADRAIELGVAAASSGLCCHPIFMGSGTDAAKNQPEARPLRGGCDEGGGHRKWLDLVHGRDRRASRHPKRHEDQDREQGRRLSGVVAGSEWTPASSALDK
jgi:hypothetical protein